MYPAPPVTRTLSFISALQAEEALQRLEQAVAPPGLRGLFEGDGRLVQELVEQRMAEVLDFSAVARAQMREAAQRALQLGGAHLSNRSRNSFRTGTTTSPPYQAQKRSTSSLTMCSAAGMSPRRSAAACAATA